MFEFTTANHIEHQSRKADLSGATTTGIYRMTRGVIHGDSTTHASGIDVNSVVYDAYSKVIDIGGTNQAQCILSRHSTTLLPLLIGARSNSNTSSDEPVVTGSELLCLWGTGVTTSSGPYDLFCKMDFLVGTGTVSATSSPGKWVLSITPDGSNTPVPAITVDSDLSTTLHGTVTLGSSSVTSLGFASGSTGAPSLYHTGDANTGLYFSANDNVDFSCAGANVLNLSTTGAVFAGPVTTPTLVLGTTTVTATGTELNYVDGVTSSIQTQLDDRVFVSGDTMTGTLGVVAGSAGSPGLFASGDTNTGMYFSAADTIDFTTAGTRVLSIDPSGDVALVSGNKLYLDGVAASGDTYLLESAANVLDLYVGGVKELSLTATGATVLGAFGCNGSAAQTAYASGGALNPYGAGANGFDTGANASALHALVVAIRAALVANGIMS